MGDLIAFDLKNRPEGWGIDFGHKMLLCYTGQIPYSFIWAWGGGDLTMKTCPKGGAFDFENSQIPIQGGMGTNHYHT